MSEGIVRHYWRTKLRSMFSFVLALGSAGTAGTAGAAGAAGEASTEATWVRWFVDDVARCPTNIRITYVVYV